MIPTHLIFVDGWNTWDLQQVCFISDFTHQLKILQDPGFSGILDTLLIPHIWGILHNSKLQDKLVFRIPLESGDTVTLDFKDWEKMDEELCKLNLRYGEILQPMTCNWQMISRIFKPPVRGEIWQKLKEPNPSGFPSVSQMKLPPVCKTTTIDLDFEHKETLTTPFHGKGPDAAKAWTVKQRNLVKRKKKVAKSITTLKALIKSNQGKTVGKHDQTYVDGLCDLNKE